MGDFSCQPPVSSSYMSSAMSEYYNESQAVCEDPGTESFEAIQHTQSLVCEDQRLAQSEQGSSQSDFSFVEAPLCDIRSHDPIPASRFQSTLENSRILASVELEAQDIDGVQSRSVGDIHGRIKQGEIAVRADVFAPSLKALEGTRSENKDQNTITEIRKNPI